MGLGGFGGCVRLGKEGGVGWGDCLIFIYVCVCVCEYSPLFAHTSIDRCMHARPSKPQRFNYHPQNQQHTPHIHREREKGRTGGGVVGVICRGELESLHGHHVARVDVEGLVDGTEPAPPDLGAQLLNSVVRCGVCASVRVVCGGDTKPDPRPPAHTHLRRSRARWRCACSRATATPHRRRRCPQPRPRLRRNSPARGGCC